MGESEFLTFLGSAVSVRADKLTVEDLSLYTAGAVLTTESVTCRSVDWKVRA